ncbi:MAG TPA: hypothetical protein V6C88_00875 [Chroococcidiopsis sp.]
MLRIEIEATEAAIREGLLCPTQFRQWLCPQRFSDGLPERLQAGLVFTSWLGPVTTRHEVQRVDAHSLHLLLSGAIDGVHHWHWGDGWVQSSIEGVSLMPIGVSHTVGLLRFKQFLSR